MENEITAPSAGDRRGARRLRGRLGRHRRHDRRNQVMHRCQPAEPAASATTSIGAHPAKPGASATTGIGAQPAEPAASASRGRACGAGRGRGIFGAALADRLVAEGWEVTLVDQSAPGTRARSRAARRACCASRTAPTCSTRDSRGAPGSCGSSSAAACSRSRAWSGWPAAQDGWETESERVLRAQGIPVERLEPGDGARLLPGLSPAETCLRPAARARGGRAARRASRAGAGRARRRRGARVETGAAEPAGAAVGLVTACSRRTRWCGPAAPGSPACSPSSSGCG